MKKEFVLAIVIASCALTAIIVHFAHKTKLPSSTETAIEKKIPPIISEKKPLKRSENYSGALDNLKSEVRMKFNTIRRDTGTGIFTGQVLTESNEPVPDVLVRAEKMDTNPYFNYYRNWDKLGVEEKIEGFVKSLEKSETNSYETRTDANGKFNLENLPTGKYTVRGVAEGYVVRDSKNQYYFETDAEILLKAKKLIKIKVEVLMPDDSLAPSALINVGTRSISLNQNFNTLPWSPENNMIELNRWNDYVNGAILSAKTENDDLSSEECKISSIPENIPESLTFKLKTFPGVKGKIIVEDGVLGLQENQNQYQSFCVYAILNKKGRDPSIEYIQQGRQQSTGSYNNYKYTFTKLIPGKYLIGCVFNERLFSAEMEVSDKMEEKDIKISVPAISDYLTTLQVSDPKGRPLKDCGISMYLSKKTGNSESEPAIESLNIQSFPSPDGLYRISCKNKENYIAKLNSGGQELIITVISISCGEKKMSFPTPPPKEINVKYEEQGFLTLSFANFGSQGYEDRISAELKLKDVKEGGANFFGRTPEINLKGELELGPVQPGQYNLTISLKTNNWQTIEILKSSVTISSGENKHAVVLPELYSLKVNANKSNAGKGVSLKKDEGKNEQVNRTFNNDGFVEFYDLPAGNYTLSINSDKEKVSIPQNSVITYE